MDRFWEKVDDSKCIDPKACWNWTAAKDPTGYGAFKVGGKKVGAHVFAYEQSYGPVPDGMEVCHVCDNRSCCRPSHLFAGTRSDNMLDASAKGRLFVPTGVRFKHGNLPPNRSLSSDQVALIKQKLKSGLFTVADISLEMGISRYIISDIKRGRTYRG
jgi:hypothetical protein